MSACGVCRTDLHVVDGELAPKQPRIVPGHQIVGVVDALGPGVKTPPIGQRVVVTWLGGACGECRYCENGHENLCDAPTFTGWSRDGGFADSALARADFCIPAPDGPTDVELAPMLCAGVIGFRAWRLACEAGEVRSLGIYGFGAAGHLLAQLAIHRGQRVHAFTRPGDLPNQALARDLGCVWSGDARASPPHPLDAAIIFAPAGELVPVALAAVRKGGAVICGGIHMSDIPVLHYALLWGERRLMSVANVTRDDVRDYLPAALAANVRARLNIYPLAEANAALADLRDGRFTGAAVLIP